MGKPTLAPSKIANQRTADRLLRGISVLYAAVITIARPSPTLRSKPQASSGRLELADAVRPLLALQAKVMDLATQDDARLAVYDSVLAPDLDHGVSV